MGYRLSKHKMTVCSKNLRGAWPPSYSWLRLCPNTYKSSLINRGAGLTNRSTGVACLWSEWGLFGATVLATTIWLQRFGA